MKKIILIALGMLVLCGTSFAQTKKIIKREQLPSAALQFIQHNWNNVSISRATMETEGYKVEYDVRLAGGTEIEFNRDGGWKEIESSKEIPESAIPVGIRTYVRQHHRGHKVVKMEKKSYGYEVTLDNDREYTFDTDGNLKQAED